jgi:hypothetical protein
MLKALSRRHEPSSRAGRGTRRICLDEGVQPYHLPSSFTTRGLYVVRYVVTSGLYAVVNVFVLLSLIPYICIL